MKKKWTYLIMIVLCVSFMNCKASIVTGQKYIGKPLENKPNKEGREGFDQAGSFEFTKDKVHFLLPGSDLKKTSTYKISGMQITFKDELEGEKFTLEIKQEGKVLIWDNTEFRRSDYPWEPSQI